jgi:hypothetical protein
MFLKHCNTGTADSMADRKASTASQKRKPRPTRDRRLERHPGYPADKRPTDPASVEASSLPERDKQYGSDDN